MRERESARDFLRDEAVPLLTLTRPGDVGKTRLALAIAGDVGDQFADGMVWVDLAPLADPALVAATVAASFSLTPGQTNPSWTSSWPRRAWLSSPRRRCWRR